MFGMRWCVKTTESDVESECGSYLQTFENAVMTSFGNGFETKGIPKCCHHIAMMSSSDESTKAKDCSVSRLLGNGSTSWEVPFHNILKINIFRPFNLVSLETSKTQTCTTESGELQSELIICNNKMSESSEKYPVFQTTSCFVGSTEHNLRSCN